MERGPLVVTVSVGLAVGLAFVPTAALAQRPHGGPGGGGNHIAIGGLPSRAPHHGVRHHHYGFHHRHHHRFHHHHGFRPFFPWGVVTVYTPPVYYGAPASYPPPVYYAPGYAPPVVYSPPTGGALAVPSVIQYAHGRYELRGDGVTTPYTWVWVPNPPPPPPPAAPPVTPPAGLPGSDSLSPARHIQLYRWTDEQGVVHWTDRADAVPPQYRTHTQRPPPS
jgi:Domain of unknown function (DUF4124)